MSKSTGNLYLCATPIGNMEDITYRVVRVLGEVDLIVAEDTRRTRKLLSFYNISNPITSYNEHNHDKKSSYILEQLTGGKEVALVSDAGMPGISDPGEKLVKEAVEHEINVVSLPGANAALAALVVSGLPAGSFVFEGFLPHKRKDKRKYLEGMSGEKRTMIFYESPNRIRETITEMHRHFGNRRVAIARELTKKFEQILRGNIKELGNFFLEKEPRGEFTLVVEGASGEQEVSGGEEYHMTLAEHVYQLETRGIHRKEAIKKVARLRGIPKREVYNDIINKKKD